MRTLIRSRLALVLNIAALAVIACTSGTAQTIVGRFDSIVLSGTRVATATVSLTNAQTKALQTTPVTLVAAPGAGKWVHPLGGAYIVDTSAGAYTNIDTYADVHLEWNAGEYAAGYMADDAGTSPPMDLFTRMFGATNATMTPIALYAETHTSALPAIGYVAAGASLRSAVENKALKVAMVNGTGDLTGGNAANTFRIVVHYAVESF